jgi:hypothetical protein
MSRREIDGNLYVGLGLEQTSPCDGVKLVHLCYMYKLTNDSYEGRNGLLTQRNKFIKMDIIFNVNMNKVAT